MQTVTQATQIRGDDEEEDQEGAASTSGRENVEPHTFLQLLGTAQVSRPLLCLGDQCSMRHVMRSEQFG